MSPKLMTLLSFWVMGISLLILKLRQTTLPDPDGAFWFILICAACGWANFIMLAFFPEKE